jgi:hypothetical protein
MAYNPAMSVFRRGVSARQLARDTSVNVHAFTQRVHELLAHLSVAEARMPLPERRREACTAIWAAITASFEASALSPEERDKVIPALQEALSVYWEMDCAEGTEMGARLKEGAAAYLLGRHPASQVSTANAIVTRLLDAIGTADAVKPRLKRSLIPLFAHRMLGNTHHLNDVKTRIGIRMPMVAALLTAAEVAASYEPVLRALRLG